MDDPHAKLQSGTMPVVEFSSRTVDLTSGTTVTVRGYNDNTQVGFGHHALKDYILWFTKFGSCELLVGRTGFENVVLTLSGLGRKDSRAVQRYETVSILSSFLMPARPAR